MEKESGDLIRHLQGLINSLNNINALLKSDQAYFVQNDAKALLNSHTQKQTCLDQMAAELAAIQRIVPNAHDHLSQAIITHFQHHHLTELPHVETLIKQLQSTLSEGYGNLMTNSDVVFMNLNYLKKLWDKLLTLSPEYNTVYEKPEPQAK